MSINASAAKHSLKHTEVKLLSSKENASSDKNDVLFEENETETELDFDIQAIILPFLATFIQENSSSTLFCNFKFKAEKTTHPIYIEVCNFRI